MCDFVQTQYKFTEIARILETSAALTRERIEKFPRHATDTYQRTAELFVKLASPFSVGKRLEFLRFAIMRYKLLFWWLLGRFMPCRQDANVGNPYDSPG